MFHLFKKGNKADQITDSFLKHSSEVIEELNGFFNSKDSFVSLKTIRELAFGKWYFNKDSTVKFKLIRLTEDEATFMTVMSPSESYPIAKFGLQRHNCKEKGVVIEGHLIDDINNLTVLKNEEWEYSEDQRHQPFATIKSIYEVTFS